MAGTSPDVVRLDVGGSKYVVSRSLIDTYPDTMLAKLVSKTWHQDPTKEIFVDRNGPRFQYVLDYMRDQKAHLAMGVSRASIFKELEYFGFENVPADAVDVSGANLQAAEQVIMAKGDMNNVTRTFEKLILKTQAQRDLSIWAYKCYQEYIVTGSPTIRLTSTSGGVGFYGSRNSPIRNFPCSTRATNSCGLWRNIGSTCCVECRSKAALSARTKLQETSNQNC